jgi:hypothetical protein
VRRAAAAGPLLTTDQRHAPKDEVILFGGGSGGKPVHVLAGQFEGFNLALILRNKLKNRLGADTVTSAHVNGNREDNVRQWWSCRSIIRILSARYTA